MTSKIDLVKGLSLNDRIYPKEFERVFKSDVRKIIRKNKINKLFND